MFSKFSFRNQTNASFPLSDGDSDSDVAITIAKSISTEQQRHIGIAKNGYRTHSKLSDSDVTIAIVITQWKQPHRQ